LLVEILQVDFAQAYFSQFSVAWHSDYLDLLLSELRY